jgi:hypothetical protein
MRARIVALAVAVASLAGSGFLARGGSAGARTGVSPTAWTETANCPGSGVTLTLTASNLHTSWHGARAHRSSSVSGDITVTARGHRAVTYAQGYQVRDAVPPDGGGTIVTGMSVQLTPGGGSYVVNGVAFLSPDGFLGRATGTTTSVCAALGI